MHKFIKDIQKLESEPFVVKKFIDQNEINQFQKLYEELPVEINNQRQKILKKKWSNDFDFELQKKYKEKLKKIIGDYTMDNPHTKDGQESLGLFQESFMPVSLHVDAGFEFDKIIYKQTLMPLSNTGETVIFKNRFYGCSTTFSINPDELSAKGYNKRSSEHLDMYTKKDFDRNIHKKFLIHEDIKNLKGLEVAMIYKWELGDLLVFDRTNLHCSSSNINKKKIGFTTSTSKK
ncbi:hypothetical protein OAP04_04335 [Pelagibacteraceae bacterium]|jgi:hypothetical protein|nr:hypothetical protein [Pelagibacteraceae bacterium]